MELEEHREAIFQRSTGAQRFLYSSPYSGEQLMKIWSASGLPKAQYTAFAILVGDIILGFYKVEDVVPLLQQELKIEMETASKLGDAITTYLSPLTDPTWQQPTVASITKDDDATKEIVEPPLERSPQRASAPLHTYANDLSITREEPSYQPTPLTPEPTYQSTQPSVREPLSGLPTYVPSSKEPLVKPVSQSPIDNKPRWSTDI